MPPPTYMCKDFLKFLKRARGLKRKSKIEAETQQILTFNPAKVKIATNKTADRLITLPCVCEQVTANKINRKHSAFQAAFTSILQII